MASSSPKDSRPNQHHFNSPAETQNWIVLKEGFLLKTRIKTIRRSTKLRLFLLKQNPVNLAAHLEYYEGFALRGWASLANAVITLQNSGVFHVETEKGGIFYLQCERGDLHSAASWVLALKQAILTASEPVLLHTDEVDAGPVVEPSPQHEIGVCVCVSL